MYFFCQFGVLLEHLLEIIGEFEQHLGILISLERLLVGRRRSNFLTNHYDRQQDKLQKRLCDPCNQGGGPASDGLRQAYERENGERVGAPHRANDVGNVDCEPSIKPRMLAGCRRHTLFLAVFDVRVRSVFHVNSIHFSQRLRVSLVADAGLTPPRFSPGPCVGLKSLTASHRRGDAEVGAYVDQPRLAELGWSRRVAEQRWARNQH